MFIIAALVQTVGFYALYNMSRKAMLRRDNIGLWLQKHRTLSKVLGGVFVLISFEMFIQKEGLGAGVLMTVIVLMMVSSLCVTLSPLKK